jgi:hypothetical protein
MTTGSASPTGHTEDHPGHDSKGRFTRGNKGGPGNPHARRTAHMRKVLLDCVSDDDLRDIVCQVVQKAKEGDTGAARLVLSYVVGKPGAAVDPDRLDVDEFELFQEETRTTEEFMRPLNGVPAGLAADLLRHILPTLIADQVGKGLDAYAEAHPDFAEQLGALQDDDSPAQQTSPPAPPPAVPSGGDNTRPARQPLDPRPVQEAPGSATSALPAVATSPLPSVPQVLAFGRMVRSALAGTRASGKPATDSKRPETAERAANPGQPASAVPTPEGETSGP